MKNLMPLLLMFVVLALGCSGQTVKNGDSVSVVYSVFDENGVLIDNNDGKPLTFVTGSGMVIKGFNYAVLGMKVGETKKFVIPPEERYGVYDASKLRITTVENINKAGISPAVGTVVYGEINNNREKGIIVNNNSTHVWIDFNHPLAGKTLIFNVELKSINARAGNALE